MTSIFVSILNGRGAPGSAPQDFNGTISILDMSSPATFVDPENMFVLTDAGGINLRKTLAYCIWVAQSCPAGAVAVTPAHLEAAQDSIMVAFVRHEFLSLWSHTDLGAQVTLRASDGIRPSKFATIVGVNDLLAVADKLWDNYQTDPAIRIRLVLDPQLSMLALVMNALHRLKFMGHNHYSDQGTKKGSETYRMLGVAGAMKEPFGGFMKKYGHDLWHIFGDDQLYMIAHALVGDAPAIVDAGYTYLGVQIPEGGRALHELVVLPQSALDRFPPGTMGLSALILGLELIVVMIDTISSRASEMTAENTVAAAEKLKVAISETALPRDVVLKLKSTLTDIIAFAHGFMSAYTETADYMAKYKSLKALEERAFTRFCRGKLIGKWFKEIDADAAGMLDGTIAALDGVGRALNAAAAAIQESTPDIVYPVAQDSTLEVYAVDLASRKREVEEAEAAQRLEAIKVATAALSKEED